MLSLTFRVFVLLHEIFIPAETWHAQYTGFLCLSSAPSKNALSLGVFEVAMLRPRFRVFVLLHEILTPAEKWHAKHNCLFGHWKIRRRKHNTCASSSRAHFARQEKVDKHDKHPSRPPCSATSTRNCNEFL